MSPRWFWRLSNWQFVLARDTSDIIISPRENSRQQKRHYNHHPLNFHFCHLFSYYHHKIYSALSLFLVSTTVNCFLTFNTFTSAIGFYFPKTVQRPVQDQHAKGTSHRINMQEELLIDHQARGTSHRINMLEELLTGSTCKRNFSQDQHVRGTSHRINMHEDLLTGSTCKRLFSQDQHARGTSHRMNMQE